MRTSPFTILHFPALSKTNTTTHSKIQPVTMPRPDLAALGVSYRRIPILSIGRDIYLDTRLIIRKLDSLFPASPAHPGLSSPSASPEHKALEHLLQIWAVDGGLFAYAAALIPTSAPVLNDSKFVKDREDYTGRSWSKESVERGRPDALVDMKRACEVLESTLLADGRKWILGGDEGPGLADIEGEIYFPLLFLLLAL
jgi:glutathione S-transferase